MPPDELLDALEKDFYHLCLDLSLFRSALHGFPLTEGGATIGSCSCLINKYEYKYKSK